MCFAFLYVQGMGAIKVKQFRQRFFVLVSGEQPTSFSSRLQTQQPDLPSFVYREVRALRYDQDHARETEGAGIEVRLLYVIASRPSTVVPV